jgi:hypothetical protein
MPTNSSRRGRPHRPEIRAWGALLARAWYHEVARALDVDPIDTSRVTSLCNAWLPVEYRKRSRLMASYRDGRHLPSLERKGPGIVAILGEHLPSTLMLVEHILWVALKPDTVMDAATATNLLAKLNATVTDDLKFHNRDGLDHRWPILAEKVRSDFPRLLELAMDYIACYVILFRQGRTGGNPAMWTCSLDNLATALSVVPQASKLACLGRDLETFIGSNFVPPGIGPRRQEPGWPFYRGGPVFAALSSTAALLAQLPASSENREVH